MFLLNVIMNDVTHEGLESVDAHLVRHLRYKECCQQKFTLHLMNGVTAFSSAARCDSVTFHWKRIVTKLIILAKRLACESSVRFYLLSIYSYLVVLGRKSFQRYSEVVTDLPRATYSPPGSHCPNSVNVPAARRPKDYLVSYLQRTPDPAAVSFQRLHASLRRDHSFLSAPSNAADECSLPVSASEDTSAQNIPACIAV